MSTHLWQSGVLQLQSQPPRRWSSHPAIPPADQTHQVSVWTLSRVKIQFGAPFIIIIKRGLDRRTESYHSEGIGQS